MPGIYLGVDALTKAVQGPQGQKLLQYLAIGPIDPQPVDEAEDSSWPTRSCSFSCHEVD
jgi:hypothetical protein